MKKARLLCAILLIGVMSASMGITVFTKQPSNITDKLTEAGYRIEEMSFAGETVTSNIISTKNDSAGPYDILEIREARNQVKALALQGDESLKEITSAKQIVKNSEGEIISQAEIFNLHEKCNGFADTMQLKNGSVKYTKKEIKQLLEATFEEQEIPVNITELQDSNLVGSLVMLEIADHNNNIDRINNTVRKVKCAISKLNTDGAMVGEFILSASDVNDSNKIIYLMAADLTSQDILWWQDIELLGASSWHTTPPRFI